MSEEAPALVLSDPDVTAAEINAVSAAVASPRLSSGPRVREFERRFAERMGREHAVAASSGTLALALALRARGLQAGDEVIAAPYAWHQIAHAISLVGATPVFADIDYWSGSLSPDKAAARIVGATRAIVAGNTNGHPAAWAPLRDLATRHGLLLVEDSTEAIGSTYLGKPVGSFGDVALFDFSQPGALVCGEGAMAVTDDAELAREMRYLRGHETTDRMSLSVGSRIPTQARMSDVAAALGLAQLARIDAILARRKAVEGCYLAQIRTFEGIKPPYVAPEVDGIHWMLYTVHLGTRFTASARNQIVEDLATAGVEAAPWCRPLHLQHAYGRWGYKRGDFPVTERIADRCIALPFHAHLAADDVDFVVQTAKDSSVNVGAGAAIYL